jgi:uncharacterized membrane protein
LAAAARRGIMGPVAMPDPPFAKPSQGPTAAPRRAWLAALVLAFAGSYLALCWRRYQSFHAQIDMSYYLRLCWGLAHGRYDLPLVQAPHLLGLHLEPVLLPLALLQRLGVPLPPLLLLVQAVAVALLAWPAWRLGCRHLGPAAAPLVAAAALLYPTVTVAALHDFHPVTLALTPLLFFVEALDDRALGRALAWGALSLCCREDIALQLALALLAYALPGRAGLSAARRPLLVALAALLIAYFLTYLVVVQPRYLPRFGSYGLHFATLPGTEGGARCCWCC